LIYDISIFERIFPPAVNIDTIYVFERAVIIYLYII